MKKILSTTLALLLVLTTVFSVSLSAQAAVRYDSDNAALYSGSGYTWLNIRGQQSYKGAFDALAKINSTRTGNAAATVPMDQELLDAAMLRAKEAYVYYNVDYRPKARVRMWFAMAPACSAAVLLWLRPVCWTALLPPTI